MQIKGNQILIFSDPKRFEPELLNPGKGGDFSWMVEMLKKKGKEKGDLLLAVVKRGVDGLHPDFINPKVGVFINEYVVQMVFRWNGIMWENVFGAEHKQIRKLMEDLESAAKGGQTDES